MVKRVLSALFIFLLMLLMPLTVSAEDDELVTEEFGEYDLPYEEPPYEEPPLEEEQTYDDQPYDDQPVDDQPYDDQPVDDQPIDEQPIEEPPIEEPPIEEPPIEEPPIEEPPAKPIEKTSAPKQSFADWAANMTQIKNMRFSVGRGTVRIVLDITKHVEYKTMYLDNPSRMVIDFQNSWLNSDAPKSIDLNTSVASTVRAAQFDKTTVRIVINTSAYNKVFELDGGPTGRRFVIDLGTPEPEPKPIIERTDEPKPAKKIETPSNDTKDISEVPDGIPSLNPVEVDEPFQKPPAISEKERKQREKLEKERAKELEKEREREEKEREKAEKERLKREKKEQREREKRERELEKERERNRDKKRVDDNPREDDKKQIDSKDDEFDFRKPFSDDELQALLNDMTSLEGKKIAIDAGHGGNDSGAIGPSGVMEKTVTLRVALALEQLLKAEGATVIMTRHDDVEVSPLGKKASAVEELKARCEVANRANADIFVSIHADSFTNPNARGSTGYYYSLGSPKSRQLADLIRRGLIEQIKTPSRGTQPCNFYVVRNTDMPATLVELAFISNPDEERLLNSKDGIRSAALGILDGIEDYFG